MKIAVSGYKCLNDINEFVEIRDISLITGKNSSGKSSFSEAYDFYLKFSNLAKNMSTFIDWFDISVDQKSFSNINLFHSGLSQKDKTFIISIDKIDNLISTLKFKYDESGFYIRLEEIQVFLNGTSVFSILKTGIKEKNNISYWWIEQNCTTEFQIQTNLIEIIRHFFPKSQKSFRCYQEYLKNEDQIEQRKTVLDSIYVFDFEEWFDKNYLTPAFIAELDSESENSISKSLKLTIDEKEKIRTEIQLEGHFYLASIKFPERIRLKLILHYVKLQINLHEKYHLKYFNHFKEIFKENKLQTLLHRFCKIKNIEHTILPKINRKKRVFFSQNEMSEILENWITELSHQTNYTFDNSKENSILSEFKDIQKRNFIASFNANGNMSYFPKSNLPSQTFYENYYSGVNRSGNEINQQITTEDSDGKRTTHNNIYQAFLKTHNLVETFFDGHIDKNGNPVGEDTIGVITNDLSLISSICYEFLGLTITNELFDKNEAESTAIYGVNFHNIWNELNKTQRLAFKNIFEKINISHGSINNLILLLTEGFQISFEENKNSGELEIFGFDQRREFISLNSIGMGHSNIVNIILEITLQITKAIHSGKSKLNLILVEPEKYSHPNLISKITHIIYSFYLLKLKKNNTERIPNISFIIETHSEYLIRSFQAKIAQLNDPSKLINIYESITMNYFEKQVNATSSRIRQIYIENDGALSDEFGSGFLDETELIIRNILNSRKQ
jgi:hypothetical protein